METYKCERCGGVFEKGWSDEEAIAEMGEVFPGATQEQCGLVCDPCYQKMRPVWEFDNAVLGALVELAKLHREHMRKQMAVIGDMG